MKRLLLPLLFLVQMAVQAQNVQPAPEDKAVVYFVRASGLGALINFTYFDSTKVIGKFNGPKYMRYECDPGEHIFWVRSENRDFIKANVEAGKIYVIDVIPQMGAVKAGVRAVPVNSPTYKMKRIQKLLTKRKPETFTESELSAMQRDMRDVVARGMKRLSELNGELKTLGGRSFEPEELKYVKK